MQDSKLHIINHQKLCIVKETNPTIHPLMNASVSLSAIVHRTLICFGHSMSSQIPLSLNDFGTLI